MERPNLLIIGAGGVGAVTAHKAVQHQDAFGRIILASRTETKLKRIGKAVAAQHADSPLETTTLNARDVAALTDFLRANEIAIVINVASTYCNTAVMDACVAAGAHYIDTSVAEDEHAENVGAPWYANHEWPRRAAFAEKKLSALLSIGFDPGVVNVFCAYAAQHLFDTIETIDIIDVNGGDHGRFFATNFDPDVNLREIKEDVIF
ncbi:MAG: saccharopine dehydrogenase NADP-binding domain-containing protein, partial [Pseudomonadota bacterium]